MTQQKKRRKREEEFNECLEETYQKIQKNIKIKRQESTQYTIFVTKAGTYWDSLLPEMD
jgi:hypothetical protein